MTLNIVVKNDKDLSQMVRVNDNGTIDYPLYQDASVVDKTTSELQDILTYKLAKMVESPMVLVSVMTETPINVYVLGQVKKPGLVHGLAERQPPGGAAAGPGHHREADLQRVKLVRKNQGDENASFYDLQKFLSTGDLALLPTLADGDRIIVLSSEEVQVRARSWARCRSPASTPWARASPPPSSTCSTWPAGPARTPTWPRCASSARPAARRRTSCSTCRSSSTRARPTTCPCWPRGTWSSSTPRPSPGAKTLEVLRDVVALITAWFVISSVLK